jgi:hypothetical protein
LASAGERSSEAAMSLTSRSSAASTLTMYSSRARMPAIVAGRASARSFADRPHRDWTTDIADAARYMAIVARHIAPKMPPKAELPPGISMDALTMSEFMDLEDGPTRPDRV